MIVWFFYLVLRCQAFSPLKPKPMKKISVLFVLIFLSNIVFASSWWSYYLSEDGNDNNDGKSPETAVASFKRIVEIIEPEYDDVYIININGTITIPEEYSFPWGLKTKVLLSGLKGTNATIQKCSDEEYLSKPNPGRFFDMSDSDCRAVTVAFSRLTIKNFGFTNTEEGGLIKAGSPCEILDCNIFNGKASVGALAVVDGYYAGLVLEDSHISGVKAISNGDIGAIVCLREGDLSMYNCVVEGCEKDYTIIGSGALDNDAGMFIHDETVRDYDDIEICNNVFYNNRVLNPNAALTTQQSLISLSQKTNAADVIITNNIFINNTRENKNDIEINNLNNSTYIITNNILSQNPTAGVDNYVDSYTYTSPEVAFAMADGKPKYFFNDYGVKYVKANGTKVFRKGSTSHYADEDILGDNRDVSEYAPCLGVIDVPFQDRLKAEFAVDYDNRWAAPASLNFTDLSFSVDEVDKWYWDFDSDGSIDATDSDPSHIYNENGSYDVTLVVESSGIRDTSTYSNYINIGLDTLLDADVRVSEGIITAMTSGYSKKNIYIPDSLDGQRVTSIDRSVFDDRDFESVKFSSSLREIGTYAFDFCEIRYLDFSSCLNLQSIGLGAFRGNELDSVNIEACESLVYIGENAFASNSIDEIILPSIKYPEFSGWTDGNANTYQAGDVFSDVSTSCVATIIYVLEEGDVVFENGQIKSLTADLLSQDIIIPDSLAGEKIISIGEEAFKNVSLNSVTFPRSLEFISESAFYGCGLTVVDFTACENLVEISEWAFYWNNIVDMKLSSETGLESIGRGAFRKNVLTNLDLSPCQHLRVVHEQAFTSCAIETLKINASLEKIGEFAFYNNQLTSMDFSDCDSLRVIGNSAFKSNELSAVDLSNCLQLSVIGSDAFSDNESLVSGGITLPSPTYDDFIQWYDVEANVFVGGSKVTNLESFYSARIEGVLKSYEVVIENGIIRYTIEPLAFTDLIIPDSLDGQEVIGIDVNDDSSFSLSNPFDANNLTAVKFPHTLQYIGDNAFLNNDLFEIDFSDAANLKKIGYNAFYGNNLRSIKWGACSSLRMIGSQAFNGQSFDFTYQLPSPDVDGFIGWADDQGQLFSTDTLVSSHRNLYARVPYVLTDADVTIEDGILLSASFPEGYFDIIIPDTLGSQLLTGLKSAQYYSQGVFYDKNLLTVQLPERIETIGFGAFSHNYIYDVNLYDCRSLIMIDDYAFNSNSLATVQLDSCNVLEYVGSNAFSENAELVQINLPKLSVTGYYGWKGSDGNEYLGDVSINNFEINYDAMIIYTLQDEDVEMQNGAILTCRELAYTDIVIPEVLDSQIVVAIGDAFDVNDDLTGVFQSSGLTSVSFPKSLKYIADYAFKDNQLDRIDLSGCENLININSGAFQDNDIKKLFLDGCSSLSNVGDYAFYGASIDSLSFAASPDLVSIGSYAFSENEVSSLDFGSHSKLSNIGEKAFYGNNLKTVDFRSCDSIEYILPGAFKSNDIEQLYFEGCSRLRTISEEAFYYNDIDSLSFEGCENLYSIGYYAFSNNEIAYLNIQSNENLSAFGTGCFSHNNLQEVLLENKDGLSILRDNVFYANDIQTLIIRNCPNLTTIGNQCFKSNALNSLTLELSSLRVIGTEAFQYANDTTLDLSLCPELTTIGDNAFYHHRFQTIDIAACHKLRSIGEFAFYSSYVDSKVVLPFSAYEEFRFWETENDEKYYEGDTLSDLQYDYTLRAWYTLQDDDVVVENGSIISCTYDYEFSDIIIPEELDGQIITSIADGGYSSGIFFRKGITELRLPTTLEKIGAYAFYDNALEHLKLEGMFNLIEISTSAFEDNSIDSLDFSECVNLEVINANAFEDNYTAYINLGETNKLRYLGDDAFEYCEVDTFDLRAYTSLEYIGSRLFYTSFDYSDKILILPDIQGDDMLGWSCYYGDFQGGDTVYSSTTQYAYTLRKWYTLQDDDVTVEEGNIVSCNYDFFFKDIIIPDSLDQQQIIGVKMDGATYDDRFQNEGLKAVIFPSSIKYLGDKSFYGNELLELDLSACDSLEYLGTYCFAYNEITEILWSEHCKVEEIDDYAFASNEISYLNLESLPELRRIGYEAFYFNSIDSLSFKFSEHLIEIGPGAFSYNDLMKVDFRGCENLESIGANAFSKNALDSVDIANCESLLSIGSSAFAYNTNDDLQFVLPDVKYDNKIAWIDNLNQSYMFGDTITSSMLSKSFFMRGLYELTDDDVVVNNGMIESCSYDYKFKDIIIPDTLDGQLIIGVKGGSSSYSGIFNGKGLYSVSLPQAISYVGPFAFSYNHLFDFDLSQYSSIRYIGSAAFMNSELDSVNITTLTDLVYLGASAFASNQISAILLPENESYPTLDWIDNLDSIYYRGDTILDMSKEYYLPIEYTLTDDDVEVINGNIVSCTYSFEAKHIIMPDTLDGQQITAVLGADSADYDYGFRSQNLRSIQLPQSLKEIGSFAFYRNNLEDVDFFSFDSLETVGDYAFAYNKLKTVDLNAKDKLQQIGDQAFYYNVIDSVDFGDCKSLEYIGVNSFNGNQVKSLLLDSCVSLRSIGDQAFYNNQLSSVNITHCYSLLNIGTRAFYGYPLYSLQLPVNKEYENLGWRDNADDSYLGNQFVNNLSSYYQVPITYTLNDDDVEVIDGVIISCSYDFDIVRIIIPDTLDGQMVTAILGDNEEGTHGPFYGRDMISIKLPLGLEVLEQNVFANNSLNNVDFGSCQHLKNIEQRAFYDNQLSKLNLSTCDSINEIAVYAFGYNTLDSLILPGAAYKEDGIWLSSDGSIYDIGESIRLLWYNSFQIVAQAQALFGMDSVSGTVPFVVHFTDSSSNNPNIWLWNFGDGEYSSQQNPIHTYEHAGTFTVSLLVSNGVGDDAMIIPAAIQVRDVMPKADFAADVVEGYTAHRVCFTDSSINYPTSWHWSFGDGAYSSQSNPTHVYDSVGIYTVSLIVGNTAGFDTLTMEDYISVFKPKPQANFVADSLVGEAPLAVSFADISLYDPSVWTWSFGDGSTSIEQHPTHIYEQAGTYTVSLIVCNNTGCDSLILADYITISGNSGLNDQAMQDINIYPNPVASVLSIKAENMQHLKLVDMSSNVLIQKVIDNQLIQLDMSAFCQGIYFLILENENGSIVQKVVKE